MNIVFSRPVSELIQKRYSCRTFSGLPLDDESVRVLERDGSSLGRGLLGETARFVLVDIPPETGGRFSDYGLIAGARSFLVGSVTRSPRFRESYAYLLEHLVLKAVDLGLDTCWVGYFSPEYFRDVALLEEGDERPAVVVVGRGTPKPRIRDRLVRAAISASARKPWRELFFDGRFGVPLGERIAGNHARPLEMVRLAPSSGNTQPWRVVRQADPPAFHFFLKKVKKSYALRGLHEVDVGIGMAHFDLACREAGITGTWSLSPPEIPLPSPDIEYRWTWSPRAA
jgi:nitroreductase